MVEVWVNLMKLLGWAIHDKYCVGGFEYFWARNPKPVLFMFYQSVLVFSMNSYTTSNKKILTLFSAWYISGHAIYNDQYEYDD